jgi:hypothetical protein
MNISSLFVLPSYNNTPLKKAKNAAHAQHVCEHLNKNSSLETVPLSLNISLTEGRIEK